jgi:hypothetical protein
MKTILFPILFIASMSLNDVHTTVKNQLEGTWIYADWEDGGMVFQKGNDFAKDKGGIQFLENGKLIKRQNAGWCGTPPITYRNYEGTWEITPNSTVKISYAYWGGTMKEEWSVVKLNDQSMKIIVLEQDRIRKNK